MSDVRTLLPHNVWCCDGSEASAATAVERAGDSPLFVVFEAGNRREADVIGCARAAVVESEVIAFESTLGPLGRNVLTETARQLTTAVDLGLITGVLSEVELAARNFVITNRPSRLHRPNPRLWQHLIGFLPSRQALGELDGEVTIVGPKGIPEDVRQDLAMPGMVLHSSGVADAAEGCRSVLTQLVEAAAPTAHIAHPPLAASEAPWWGPHDAIEIAALPAELSPFIDSARRRARTCPWCGLSAVGPVCAFCSQTAPSSHPVPRPEAKGHSA